MANGAIKAVASEAAASEAVASEAVASEAVASEAVASEAVAIADSDEKKIASTSIAASASDSEVGIPSEINSEVKHSALISKAEVAKKIDHFAAEYDVYEKYRSDNETRFQNEMARASHLMAKYLRLPAKTEEDLKSVLNACADARQNAETYQNNYRMSLANRNDAARKLNIYKVIDAHLTDREVKMGEAAAVSRKYGELYAEIQKLNAEKLRFSEADDGAISTPWGHWYSKISMAPLQYYNEKSAQWGQEIGMYYECIKQANQEAIESSKKYAQQEITLEQNVATLRESLKEINRATGYRATTQSWLHHSLDMFHKYDAIEASIIMRKNGIETEEARHEELVAEIAKIDGLIAAEMQKLD